jgi:Zn finger protein HypA/HybF involved in hydrogenase expression
MSLWSRLFRRRAESAVAAVDPAPRVEHVIELPAEPFVFECRVCGKVFEARRLRPLCPECDGDEVDLVSA